jgi:hypothetical protein
MIPVRRTRCSAWGFGAAWLIGLGLALPARHGVADDSLSLLRDEVRAPSDEPEEEEPEEPSSPCHDCHDEPSLWGDLFGDFFVTAAFLTVGSPFWVPHAIHDDGLDVRGAFPRFPYEAAPGHMLFDYSAPCERYWWSTRVTAEYADVGSIDRLGVQALAETSSRWGGDVSFNHWSQDFGPPAAGDDSIWTGDVNLLFRFVQSERVQMRTGLGLNWLADDHGSDFGFNFTYGGDVFPAPPLVLSADLDWGWLGSAGLLHFRGTSGILFGPAEIFAGYDYFDVGGAQFDGLVAGVRFWL